MDVGSKEVYIRSMDVCGIDGCRIKGGTKGLSRRVGSIEACTVHGSMKNLRRYDGSMEICSVYGGMQTLWIQDLWRCVNTIELGSLDVCSWRYVQSIDVESTGVRLVYGSIYGLKKGMQGF